MSRLRRWGRRLGLLAVVLVVAAAAPIVFVETTCRSPAGGPMLGQGSDPAVIDDPEFRRLETTSFLSYPEWYIVHAYEDLAGVLAGADEDAFDYTGSIGGFWSSLCAVNRLTDGGDVGTKVMLYTIGLSFTAEMGVKGLYEETLGRLFVWIRGDGKTEEDRFALAVAEDYAAFLRQTPWYLYDFTGTVGRLWREPGWEGDGFARKLERRLALSLEWGVKAGYAKLIGTASAATLGLAKLRIRSVVSGVDAGTVATLGPDVQLIRDPGDGRLLIETPRYRAFTEVLKGLAQAGGEVVEIAGNDDILVTLIARGDPVLQSGARQLFAIPIQSRPGERRVGVAVPVRDLATLIRSRGETVRFEHAYDY